MRSEPTVSYRWVVGQYTGEKAKKILSMGGMTYKIWSVKGKGAGLIITAALKWIPANKPMPPHIEVIRDEEIIDGLERWSKPWLAHEPPKPELTPQEQEEADSVARAAALFAKPAISPAAKMFPKAKGKVEGWDQLYQQ